MKKCLLQLLVLLLASAPAFAQTVSGRVTNSADGQGLPGVSVLVKGTTVGTTTDSDGKFTISAGENSTLVFSFIGFATQEVAINNRTSVDISLAEDISQLGEVVVTALGIEKDTRSLAYSVATVDGEKLTQAREINVANSLVGRVAGVNVSGVSGGPGSSSNVVIRGISNLTGSSPLYVINGVPIDNTPRGSAGQWGGADLGDGIGNINPDDIADITVLKGATAGALYGSRGTNGVILITTKKGKGIKGVGIDFNSNYTFDRAINMTDFQYEYGQGINGVKPATQADAAASGSSWGAPLDGSDVVQFDGTLRPYSAVKDNYKDFYNSGSTFTNTLAIGGSNDKGGYRFSVSNLSNKSIVPNSGLNRKTFNLNLNYKIIPKLSFDVVSNYVTEKADNRPTLSDSPGNANFGVTFLPSSYDVDNFAPGYTEGTGAEILVNTNNIYYTNPWFAANRFSNDLNRNRFINIATVRYNPLEWLTLQARVANDLTFDRQTNITPTGTAYRAAGDITEVSAKGYETNADFLVTGNRDLTEGLNFNLSVGGNMRMNKFESLTSNGQNFSVPFLYVLGNTVNRQANYDYTETRVPSLYYMAEFNYKDMLFLNTTGRKDWFSTLDGRDIFYPSVGASFVFSDLLGVDLMNMGRLRGAWAQSTGDPTFLAYQTNLYYNLSGSANGFPLGQITNGSIPNSELVPYSLTETELGLDLRFFNDRIGLDVAYYNRQTENELLNVTTSMTSGYTSASLNVGSLENKGFELLLTAVPVKTQDFNWNISFNYTKNNNKVVKLNEGLESIGVATSRSLNAFVQHVEGEAASQVRAFDYVRDANGNIVHDAAGYPLQGELKSYGSGVHPIFGGVNNEFNYKGLNLSFLIDFKSGGKIFSATDYYAYIFGLHKNTLVGRGEDIVSVGVDEAGETNTVGVAPWDYYSGASGVANRISSQFVYDASFVKLRQVVFGYNIPSSILRGTFIQSLNLSFVARNVAILKKHTQNIDPEANINNTIGQGLELAGVPPMRSYGFNLSAKF